MREVNRSILFKFIELEWEMDWEKEPAMPMVLDRREAGPSGKDRQRGSGGALCNSAYHVFKYWLVLLLLASTKGYRNA